MGQTHLLAFEIHLRRGRVLLMLRALKQGLALDPDNIQLHGCLVKFMNFVEKNKNLPEAIATVLKNSFLNPEALTGKTATQLNDAFLAKYKNDLAAQFIGAKMMMVMSDGNAEKAIKVATNLDSSLSNRNLEVCQGVLESLQDGDFGSAGKSASDNYKKSCCEIFPLAKCFMDISKTNSKEIIKNNSNRDVES